MSCFGCSRKYGIFCKEYGCPNCGYSYCLKCLKRSAAVPRQGGRQMNVCVICYDKLSKQDTCGKVIDADELPGTLVAKAFASASTKSGKDYLEEAAAMFEGQPPAELGAVLQPVAAEVKIANNENSEIADNLDCAISKRLKDLKTVDDLPSDDEIRTRLCNLKGLPNKDYSKKELLLTTDRRTDQQKMNDLLDQFLGETKIEQRIQVESNEAISDIERRLKALRDEPIDCMEPVRLINSPDTNANTPSDNEQEEEVILESIVEKYLAEARLPTLGSVDKLNIIPNQPSLEDEELPWCTICNENATCRCKGCDGELFCTSCFRECHSDEDERVHVKEDYNVAPPEFKDDHF